MHAISSSTAHWPTSSTPMLTTTRMKVLAGPLIMILLPNQSIHKDTRTWHNSSRRGSGGDSGSILLRLSLHSSNSFMLLPDQRSSPRFTFASAAHSTAVASPGSLRAWSSDGERLATFALETMLRSQIWMDRLPMLGNQESSLISTILCVFPSWLSFAAVAAHLSA